MPTLTDHLRDEISVLRVGLERLEQLAVEASSGRGTDVEGLRTIVFSLRLLFKRNFLVKLERVLYPALTAGLKDSTESVLFDEGSEIATNAEAQFKLMRLQLVIDEMSNRWSKQDNLTHCIEDCLESIRRVLSLCFNLTLPLADRHLDEAEQNRLYAECREIDVRQCSERAHATHVLVHPELSGAIGS
jgi:hypothetical protein